MADSSVFTNLNGLTGASGATASLASATQKTMGKEDFLKLLTTQLKYQDPLSPEDPKDFVAQLAQFSALEQQINANSNLKSLGTLIHNLNNSMNLAQGVNLLGKEVQGVGNTLTLTGGQALGASFELPQSAREVSVGIYSSAGTLVRTLNLGAQSAGARTFTWDGKDSSGKTLADGSYSYQVAAKDASGKNLSVTNYFTGTVQEVFQDSQGVWLIINGRRVLLNSIVSVAESSQP